MAIFSFSSYRPPAPQPNRLACNWMLVSALSAFALHVSRLPIWLCLAAAGLLLWRYFIENYSWRIPRRTLRWLLLIVFAVTIYRQYGTLFGREAGIGFLTLLVGLKIIEIKTLRDYLVTMFLVYLLVMAHFLHSQSLAGAFSALLVILVATHTLVLLNRATTGRATETLRMVGAMFLQALPLLLVLYFLFPRIHGSFWQTPLDTASGRTGMSDQVSPGSINKLYNDHTVAFRAEFIGRVPTASKLYWRAFVLSETDGVAWRKGRPGLDIVRPWRYGNGHGNPVEYNVTLEPHYQNWVPALDLPARPDPRTTAAPGYTLTTKRKLKTRRRFSLVSFVEYETGQISAAQRTYNTRWTGSASRRLSDLVGSWQSKSTTPGQVVQLALQHFRTEPFRYTLTPPTLGASPVDDFMFNTRAGYCEHYASAFAAMMRLAEIPTRLVIGYQGGEWNQIGRYLVVRQSDAHAWTEVWLRDQGWTRVDPTAAVAPERIELGADAIRELAALGSGIGDLGIDEARRLIAPSWIQDAMRVVRQRWDAVNNAWNEQVIGYDQSAQRRLLSFLGFKTPDWVATLATLGVGVLTLMLLLAAVVLYKRRPRDPVLQCYEKFCKKLTRIGIRRQHHEGPMAFAQRLFSLRPDLQIETDAITKLYIKLRYGAFDQRDFVRLRKQVSTFHPSKDQGAH